MLNSSSVSEFAQKFGHPLCDYLDQIPFQTANKQKSKIHFLSGDPTAYGNNKFRMPQAGYQIMRNAISDSSNHGYTLTNGIPAARQAILKLYKSKNAMTVNNVVIQHGVNQGLLVALMSFTNPGDQILVPQIGYPIYQKIAPALGVKVVHYKLKPSKHYQIDLQHLASVLTQKSQFLFVINPSNPMGTIFSKHHMQQIIKFCDKHQLPIVSDEVYHGETFQGVQYHSFGDVTDHVPVIVLCGVQKLLSVPGWCTSWSVLFDRHNYLEKVWKGVGTFTMIFLHSNKFTQAALPELLEKVGQFTKQPIKQTKVIHDKLHHELKKIKGFHPVQAQGTFYMTVLIDMTVFSNLKTDLEFVNKLLEEQNIALLPLTIFGGHSNGFRLLTCGEPEIYNEFIKRLSEFCHKHQK